MGNDFIWMAYYNAKEGKFYFVIHHVLYMYRCVYIYGHLFNI